MTDQFLPICDVLYNIISLGGYFCDLVFDLVFGYALLERGNKKYFAIVITFVAFSLIVSQIVSLKFLRKKRRSFPEQPKTEIQPNNISKLVYGLHFALCGVLWRYAKLFVPVDLRNVKHEVRDLCMLRLIHAFCGSAPMLLLQLYVLVTIQNEDQVNLKGQDLRQSLGVGGSSIIPQSVPTSSILYQQTRTFKDLNTISAVLSLFSVCWALASFSKNVRIQNVHRLILTWMGVIFQFLWRCGTVLSRVLSLTVYASLYNHWIFLVIILHWTSMLCWLVSPKNVFHGEKISRTRKAVLSALIAFIYIIAYINLQEVNHRQKMFIFYTVMFLENLLLVSLWMVGIWPERTERWYLTPVAVLCSFCIGIFFMLIYYRYFHVRRLSGGRPDGENCHQTKCCSMANTKNCKCKSRGSCYINDGSGSKYPPVPGVFNCRFTNPVNGATKRKKKKPTTFVPPPNLRLNGQTPRILEHPEQQQEQRLDQPFPMSVPFWKRQISLSQSSENESSSVGSRVNIQQKLQEKKQKQLAELKVIEEEIKQGKLVGPNLTGTSDTTDDGRLSLPRQPIPRSKKHIDLDPKQIWANDNGGYSNLVLLQGNSTENGFGPVYGNYLMDEIHQSSVILGSGNINRETSTPINNLNMPNENNSLTRTVISKVPRNFHQNIQGNNSSNTNTNSTIHSVHKQDTNTTNSNKSAASNQRSHLANYHETAHLRQCISGMYNNAISPNHQESQFPYNVIPPPKNKLDSNRANWAIRDDPLLEGIESHVQNPAIIQLLQQNHRLRTNTPEVLLSPRNFMEGTSNNQARAFYEWNGLNRNMTNIKTGMISSEDDDDSNLRHHQEDDRHSDMDSQMSLPRSYTLPREFKYYRRNKARKMEFSNNSSDGDVDSVDDNESDRNSSNPSRNHNLNCHTNSKNFYQNMMHGRHQQPMSGNYPHHNHHYPPNISGRVSVPAVGKYAPSYNQFANGGAPQSTNNYVHNLDLISSVMDKKHPPFSRRGRGAGGVRHETKL